MDIWPRLDHEDPNAEHRHHSTGRGPGAWPDMSIRKMPWWALRGWPQVPGLVCSLNRMHTRCPRGKGRAQQAHSPHAAAFPLERSRY